MTKLWFLKMLNGLSFWMKKETIQYLLQNKLIEPCEPWNNPDFIQVKELIQYKDIKIFKEGVMY